MEIVSSRVKRCICECEGIVRTRTEGRKKGKKDTHRRIRPTPSLCPKIRLQLQHPIPPRLPTVEVYCMSVVRVAGTTLLSSVTSKVFVRAFDAEVFVRVYTSVLARPFLVLELDGD